MDKILEKIRKLLALTTSPNEAEATNAAQMAQEILLKHNLSLQDVEAYSDEGIQINELDGSNKNNQGWRIALAICIAQTHYCKAMRRMHGSSPQLCLIGRPRNAIVARHVYEYLTEATERLTVQAYSQIKSSVEDAATGQMALFELLPVYQGETLNEIKGKRGEEWKIAFRQGVVYRLNNRLQQQFDEQQQNGIPSADISALACRSQYEREMDTVEEWITHNLYSRTVGLRTNVDNKAFYAGIKAADTISLSSQLQQGTTRQKRLRPADKS